MVPLSARGVQSEGELVKVQPERQVEGISPTAIFVAAVWTDVTFVTWIGKGVSNWTRKGGLDLVYCFRDVCMPVSTAAHWINKEVGHGAIGEDPNGYTNCLTPQTPLGGRSLGSGRHGVCHIGGATNWAGRYPRADLIQMQEDDPDVGKILPWLRESKKDLAGTKLHLKVQQ